MSRAIPALVVALVALLTTAHLPAQQGPHAPVPRVWTDEALAGWAVPIAGVKATPTFYTEREYYAAPIDEPRTYPVYLKSREPSGYREWIRKQGPQPVIDARKLRTEADWIMAGRDVFDSVHLSDFRTADPRAFAWADDSTLASRRHVTVAADGTIPGARWLIDRDGQLKITMSECGACHTRILPDGTAVRGAQSNLALSSLPRLCFEQAAANQQREGRSRSVNDEAYASYGVPWLADDINAQLKTMTPEEIAHVDGPAFPGTFVRFNASPWFTTKIPDLIGIKERKYLDATATHRNRGPEDVARYAILVATADDGSIGPHRFVPEPLRALRSRPSDEAMLALGKFIYSLRPPPNPHRASELTARGQLVFTRSGCASCHTPPLYTNNKLAPVEGFTSFPHPNSVPQADVLTVPVGSDAGLALRTRKGTGYYKVPSLRGVWYRSPIEHSGSILTLEDWLDPRRLRDDYVPTGWNPPDRRTRAISGHPFGLTLSMDDKRALIAFLRTL